MGNPTARAMASVPDDRDLIDLWRKGDQRGATQLVERHGVAVGRFAVSLGVREEVDELVQDTFVRAFQALDSFRGESSFRTWLFTICKRLILDRRRAERRKRDVGEVDESFAASEYNVLDSIVADESARKVRDAVAGLPAMQRDVFLLRVSDGLPYSEIAVQVGSSEGACRVHYFNAMRTIKEYLSHD